MKTIEPSTDHQDETQGTAPLALPQTGSSTQPSSTTKPLQSKPSAAPKPVLPRTGQDAQPTHRFPLALPAGQRVQLKDHRAARVYTVLSGQLDQRTTDSLSLTLQIRSLNNGPMDAEFSSNNFRLLVDGIPRAPTNSLNDLVAQHSAKEGTVEFSFSATTEHLVLQVLVGHETAEIPLDLKAALH